jgi:NADH-quinone oxidoreductase subunit L
MFTGWLAICGILPFAGFFSKDEILYKTFAADKIFLGGDFPGNKVLWIIGLITAVMTAVYMTRMMVMTFWGKERFHGEDADVHAYSAGDDHADDSRDDDEEEHHHALPPDFKPHESPWTMTVPLIILAFLSTVGGLVGIPYALSGGAIPNVFEHTLEPVIAKKTEHNAPVHGEEKKEVKHFFASETKPEPVKAEEHAEHSPEELFQERLLAGLSVILAAGGMLFGWFTFRKNPLKQMPKLFENKWYVDEIYNKYIVDPITNFSRNGLWKGFDLGVIDGVLHGIGQFVTTFGSLARSIQVGFVRSYAAFILLGALLVLGYFIYYGLKLVG